jgi:hypothetical protein
MRGAFPFSANRGAIEADFTQSQQVAGLCANSSG